ncbi:eCIS core domain-containing protein [Arthrobacter antioxidans]|uniref:eCIS core domain-containing protein n=1 Tax=Arthrobacter antioxidans TaxID=2895818 RepID=UPI001FFE9AB9|nr:DUF4157 domain-containing protein [Arthrobacter antioxidans]
MTRERALLRAPSRQSTSRPVPAPKEAALSPAQALGNQFMRTVQPKMTVNAPGDAYEQEADRLAGRVVAEQMPQPQSETGGSGSTVPLQFKPLAGQVTPLVQRAAKPAREKKKPAVPAVPPAKPAAKQPKEPKEPAQETKHARRRSKEAWKKDDDAPAKKAQTTRKNAPQLGDEDDAVHKPVQKKGGAGEAAPGVEEDITRMEHGGRPLDPATRAYFESRFGADFGTVRIHDDADAAQVASSVNAEAFTQGRHIFFNSGRYAPAGTSGRRLLAHELTHVIQQGATPVAAPARQERAAGSPVAAPQRSADAVPTVQRQNEENKLVLTSPPWVPVDIVPRIRMFGADHPRPGLGFEAPDNIVFESVKVPGFKLNLPQSGGYSEKSEKYAGAHRFGRSKNYSRRGTNDPKQRDVWADAIKTEGLKAKLNEAISAVAGHDHSPRHATRHVLKVDIAGAGKGTKRAGKRSGGSSESLLYFGTAPELLRELIFPSWDKKRPVPQFKPMQVDHIVELQIGNWADNRSVNNIENLFLLAGGPNQQSGEAINAGVEKQLADFIVAVNDRAESAFGAAGAPESASAAGRVPGRGRRPKTDTEDQLGTVKRAFNLRFSAVAELTGRGAPPSIPEEDYYTKEQVEAGIHMDVVKAIPHSELGSAEQFFIFTRRRGGRSIPFSPSGAVTPEEEGILGRMLKVTHKRFDLANTGETTQDGEFASLTAAVAAPFKQPEGSGAQLEFDFTPLPFPFKLKRILGTTYAGYLDLDAVSTHFKRQGLRISGLSPVRINELDIDDGGLVMSGAITPEVPLLSRTTIDWELRNGQLQVFKAFSAADLDVPSPFVVDAATLVVSLGSRSGLGVRGDAHFGIDKVGRGFVESAVRSGTGRSAGAGSGFSLAGGFDFDSNLFDPAGIRLRYEDGRFSGEGTLGIPEGKIRGIRSAELSMVYADGRFTADGTVRPSIPGVREGSMSLEYSEQDGLVISGTLQLAENPAIRNGSLQARVERKPDGSYKVSAAGTAEPAIPNVNSRLAVAYDDGAFDATVTADFTRGLLSGALQVAATNRPVDPATDQPAGDPGEEITVYGGGSMTMTFSPWLQGTVGIRLLPNGEIELSGEVALPSAVEVFPERRYDRNIFSVNLDIPIVGVSVLGQNVGIYATIGGGLDLSAGIGPGTITGLSLGVTYNPDHEEQTHVVGQGEFIIPADAGLRLFIRGGIGAGIPVVSARAGIELGGQLGLAGEARAAVDVDWTPQTGVVLAAVGSVFVEPKFKFDVTAFVEVTADLVVDKIDLYSERWRLTDFEYGSALRFGVEFPVHYADREPFDLSLDDLRFTVPEVDAMAALSELLGI